MNLIHRALIFAVFLGAPGLSAQEAEPADEDWLRLDLIVFKRALRTPSVFDETWRFVEPERSGAVDFDDPLTLAGADARLMAADSAGSIDNLASALSRSGRYSVLQRASFAVAPKTRDLAAALRIHDGSKLALSEPASFEQVNFDWFSSAPGEFSAGTPATDIDRLDGTVKVFRERFLHLAVDLNLIVPLSGLAEPWPDADGRSPYQTTDVQSYRLLEKRRLKTDTVHYFDHPRIGVIAHLSWVPVDSLPPPPEFLQ